MLSEMDSRILKAYLAGLDAAQVKFTDYGWVMAYLRDVHGWNYERIIDEVRAVIQYCADDVEVYGTAPYNNFNAVNNYIREKG